MPLGDTFSETVNIILANNQIKNGCLSPHVFRKIYKVRQKVGKNITIIAGPTFGKDMKIRTVIQKTVYITYIT